MFTPVHLLPLYDDAEHRKYRDRWVDNATGHALHDRIMEMIREGAGEDFLQSEFEGGRLGFLEDMWDLKGFQIQSQDLTVPDGDTFEAIQFWYAEFWHTTFRHAVFLSNFRVARFYNCTFIDCVFAHTGFYGAILEKVRFLDCEFIEEDSFTACDLTAVEFRQCFMPHRLFYDCRFDAATTVEDSSDRPHRTTPSGDLRPKAELTNVYKGIKEGYVAGDVPHLARRFFFRQRQAATRYNSRNRQEKAVGLFQEFVAGYGIRPERPLAAMALVLVLSLAVFLFAMTPTDAFLLATGALFTFGANTDALKRLGPAYKLIYVATAFLGISLTALFITVLANVWFRERL